MIFIIETQQGAGPQPSDESKRSSTELARCYSPLDAAVLLEALLRSQPQLRGLFVSLSVFGSAAAVAFLDREDVKRSDLATWLTEEITRKTSHWRGIDA